MTPSVLINTWWKWGNIVWFINKNFKLLVGGVIHVTNGSLGDWYVWLQDSYLKYKIGGKQIVNYLSNMQ
jgi:hypothetical protein